MCNFILHLVIIKKSQKLSFGFLVLFLAVVQTTGWALPLKSDNPRKPAIRDQQKISIKVAKRKLPAIYSPLIYAAQAVCPKGDCNYPLITLENDLDINAYSDGDKIYITGGMLSFAQKREELALILAHEIAHNIMNHITSKQKNALFGLIFDLAAVAGGVDTQGVFAQLGSNAYTQEFEFEADYIGLYIMARAGFSVNNAAYFWRRMALKFPDNIHNHVMVSHPGSSERFLLIEKTAEEINRKKARHQPLVPEFIKKN